uniref:NADH-ubiquinone oxidoreductase chain 3 n=1 Tax=Gasteruption parvicollarium TaxID=1738629 RepID=A0A2S0AZR6_9HYME|nr:NADH dehydrogenase subunit 3 [Gasteruption parvicollarium]ALJ93744.1 NADH dehydrogenase subunit 3 [Gasteruption parvicollarium]
MLNMLIMMSLFSMIVSLMILINKLMSKKNKKNREKNSPFECGFDPFKTTRLPFSLHFFLISLIFLIFDIEITLMLPLINMMMITNKFWLNLTFMIFMLILILGIFIEWKTGVIKWLK